MASHWWADRDLSQVRAGGELMSKPTILRTGPKESGTIFTAYLDRGIYAAGIVFDIWGHLTLSVSAVDPSGNKMASWNKVYASADDAFADFSEWAIDYSNLEKEETNEHGIV